MGYGFSNIIQSSSPQNPVTFRPQRLYNLDGGRKYITGRERDAALAVARLRRPAIYTFFATLAYSGCRLSEALELDASRIDFEQCGLIFRTLKKRQAGVFRLVPVPAQLLDDLDSTHSVRARQREPRAAKQPLWTWSRTHAWRLMKGILCEAGVQGAAATPKGLRHGFGVTAVTKGVPLNLVQRWLGHTQLATTAIYADALGDEERHINTRMWS